MRFLTNASLLCAAAVLCFAACSPGPDADLDPIAGPDVDPTQTPEGSPVTNQLPANAGEEETVQNGIKASRLRLPDMENLPSDGELATSKDPGKTGSGVIARPPSE